MNKRLRVIMQMGCIMLSVACGELMGAYWCTGNICPNPPCDVIASNGDVDECLETNMVIKTGHETWACSNSTCKFEQGNKACSTGGGKATKPCSFYPCSISAPTGSCNDVDNEADCEEAYFQHNETKYILDHNYAYKLFCAWDKEHNACLTAYMGYCHYLHLK